MGSQVLKVGPDNDYAQKVVFVDQTTGEPVSLGEGTGAQVDLSGVLADLERLKEILGDASPGASGYSDSIAFFLNDARNEVETIQQRLLNFETVPSRLEDISNSLNQLVEKPYSKQSKLSGFLISSQCNFDRLHTVFDVADNGVSQVKSFNVVNAYNHDLYFRFYESGQYSAAPTDTNSVDAIAANQPRANVYCPARTQVDIPIVDCNFIGDIVMIASKKLLTYEAMPITGATLEDGVFIRYSLTN